MWGHLKTEVKPAFLMLMVLIVITGVIYTLLTTVAAQLLFPEKANGSLITRNGVVFGSKLIGQTFTDPKYFWGRPSENSAASNLSITNPRYLEKVATRVQNFQKIASETTKNIPIPIDLVTESGSGLDPDISPAAAYYQVERVAKARGLAIATVQKLVADNITNRQFDFFGEARVNVLNLNLALDGVR